MIKQEDSRQQQILKLLLNSSSGICIDEMAAALQISRTAVKQHLVTLEKLELVEAAALNSQTGGRPARGYSLTEKGINSFTKQYSWFCNLLLDELAGTLQNQALATMMWQLGVKLGKSLAPQFSAKNPEQKQAALVELMQNLGYHAELEQDGDQTSIKANNCVYHDLAQQHPEVCQFDLGLMTTLLDTPILQTACMANKDCDCRFSVTAEPDRKIDPV